ncbi:MAG: uroporphyrinogen-III synthase [Bacteroidetes bacterium]|nr:MAG: uroporphyrinogen-III synthase [Bacteroidota bacterium]
MSKKIKTLLISQPKPETEKSPYFDLAKKYKLKIDFRPFIEVRRLDALDFRKRNKININDFNAVIFTSRNSVDHFFSLAKELRATLTDNIKYFCFTEAVAYYLQKYTVYRKRRIFFGEGSVESVIPLFDKFKDSKFLLPTSNTINPKIIKALDKAGIDYTRACFYETIASDLSDLKDIKYDVLAFFSPSGINSLFENFPDFKQNDTVIATLGTSTAKAAEERGLKVQIKAPTPETPSMTMALEKYIVDTNNAIKRAKKAASKA